MKAHDRRALARLLKNADGDWNELRRSYEAEPQPGRGRPLGAAKRWMTICWWRFRDFLRLPKNKNLRHTRQSSRSSADLQIMRAQRCFAISLARASSWIDACIERTKTANVDGN